MDMGCCKCGMPHARYGASISAYYDGMRVREPPKIGSSPHPL
ncbi:Hypothetical protein A7982_04559 [Minicystis rosea]|nr:Hypothetical protein A7982_04559 [Minicystis rosea]